ncbi:uncharacterized protein P174DRAFT_11611 [Aspergillus novofumigatus IBT 16806]|uniref:Uncharacterized protein n=1 Tax=Aspergillus novofumigatus (strain IBT 16806) TaxID=1392255 RepID=A0A2I1CL05_ASPN1|nr:uncharacterized protein P174DRAFT_11611 [Aspergillus novofumigatus IBT 16806]PKX98307.1 hypothetical protein P174DRAFT_11611 [Aspergillus novofumigatus IBT 16806]
MLQCSSLCMLLGLIFLFPVPELLCLPISEIPGHGSAYLDLQNTMEIQLCIIFRHHYPLLRKYRQGTYGKSGKAGQYAIESTWNGMSIRQQNDSIHTKYRSKASVLSIVQCSCIHQYATCINRSSGHIAANHNRLTDLEEADTWKVVDPFMEGIES